MGFESIVISLLSKTIKATQTFYFGLEELKNELVNIITIEDLIKFNNKKNNLSKVIIQTQNNINTLSKTSNTVDKIVTGLEAVVTIIKVLPVPTSFPPGAGIPMGVINTVSDTLDTIKDNVRKNKNINDGIKKALNNINDILSDIKSKLNQLDKNILDKVETLTQSLSEEDKNKIQQEINITIDDDKIIGEVIEEYKGYIFKIETNPKNKFSFPQRRAIAYNKNNPYQKIIGEYSYSSNVDILIEELKFEIDKNF